MVSPASMTEIMLGKLVAYFVLGMGGLAVGPGGDLGVAQGAGAGMGGPPEDGGGHAAGDGRQVERGAVHHAASEGVKAALVAGEGRRGNRLGQGGGDRLGHGGGDSRRYRGGSIVGRPVAAGFRRA